MKAKDKTKILRGDRLMMDDTEEVIFIEKCKSSKLVRVVKQSGLLDCVARSRFKLNEDRKW